MEQHPVPQNVTAFQFQLIGNMTVKQFGYLATGAVVAYVCYKLPLPVIFTIPLSIASALLGYGLAFVPIEERPMDTWVFSFLKSAYNPTLFIWQKTSPIKEPASVLSNQPTKAPIMATAFPPTPSVGEQTTTIPARNAQQGSFVPPTTSPEAQMPHQQPIHQTPTSTHPNLTASKPIKPGKSLFEKMQDLLFPPPKIHTGALPLKKAAVYTPAPPQLATSKTFVKKSGGIFAGLMDGLFPPKQKHISTQQIPVAASFTQPPQLTGVPLDLALNQDSTPPVPSPKIDNEEALAKTKDLESKLNILQKELASKTATEDRILELQKQLTSLIEDKQKMEAELIKTKSALTQQQNTPATIRQAIPVSVAPKEPTVKIITQEAAVRSGLIRLTTFPNIITGIIKDVDGNFLPGVLVTVRDTAGIPLRAFKTNKIGQFAASTPLPDNTYMVEVEDPRGRFSFDKAQITLNGSVVPAIEVVAKSQKELDRQKLSQELFSNKI